MHYKLELSDQSGRDGEFGEDGFLGLYEIESGTCKLTLVDPRVFCRQQNGKA